MYRSTVLDIDKELSWFQRFARLHPTLSLMFFISGIILPVLIIPGILFGIGLFKEWRRITPGNEPLNKPTNFFKDEEITLGEIKENVAENENKNEVLAKITHYGDLAVLEIHTKDPKLAAQAQGRLMAKYFISFYVRYLKVAEFGFAHVTDADRKVAKEMRKNKVNFVAQQIAKRIEFSEDIESEKAILLNEFNSAVDNYNKEVPLEFRIKKFTEQQLDMVYAGCDIIKGLGSRIKKPNNVMNGCSALVREVQRTYEKGDKQIDKTFVEHGRTLDWWSGGALADYTIGVIRHTPYADDENTNKPKKTFELTFVPATNGLSIANDKGLVITLNELSTMKNMRTKDPRLEEGEKGNAQFVTMRMIAQECSTVEEVKTYLDKKAKFAAPFIITASDNEGKGAVFEILPPDSEERFVCRDLQDEKTNTRPYNFLEMNQNPNSYQAIAKRQKNLEKKQKSYGPSQTVTNHPKGNQQASAFKCSPAREKSLDQGVQHYQPLKQIFGKRDSTENNPVNGPSSVQTMRFKRKYNAESDKFSLHLRFNWRNRRSGGIHGKNDPLSTHATILKNEKYASDGFTKINLSECFDRFST